jgi:hypothetical protein
VVSKGRRKKEKVKTAQKLAENTADKKDEIQNAPQEKEETKKNSEGGSE